MPKDQLVNLREIRLQKMQAIQDLGINPYPAKCLRTHYAKEILDSYEEYSNKEVVVAGRLMSWRPHGSLTFGHIQDQSGQIQLVLEKNSDLKRDSEAGTLGYSDLNLIDMGDFLEVAGSVVRTRRGEISVRANKICMLAKSLRPLPEKWHGLRDRESILRRRYLHTICKAGEKERFEKISKMIYAIRRFLDDEGFLEFNTPVLQPQYGGGTANPFVTHVNALHCKMYLSISHELYLKRLIAAGFDKVYTIGKYFRNEGIDRYHHPEFSMLETMTAYENYEYNMDLIEALFRYVGKEVFGKYVFTVGGCEVNFEKPWKRIPMVEAVFNATGIDFHRCKSVDEANLHLKSLDIEDSAQTIGKALLIAFEERVAPGLVNPTFIYHHPVDVSPLAKPSDADPRYSERFEIFIGGIECGDNWTEQNDPLALLQTWRSLQQAAKAKDEVCQPIDYDFIEVLEHGMPPTTGIGPGIERMAMILTEQVNIDDVIFFPIRRPVLSPANAAIYGVDELPIDRQHGFEDVVMSMEEFQDLLGDGILSPQTADILIRPYIRIWERKTIPCIWKASGHLEVEGFLLNSRLLLSGYNVKAEQSLSSKDETRGFKDAIEHNVVEEIKEHYPDCSVQVSEVIELEAS